MKEELTEKQLACRKTTKKTFKIIGLVCLCLVGVLICYSLFALIYHVSYTVKFESTINNDTDYVVSSGKSLYDKDGKALLLRGTNAGNWLIWEGWLGATSLGYEQKDGKIAYNETPMAFVLDALNNNKNLNESDKDIILLRSICKSNPSKYWWYEEDCSTVDLLLDWYYSNWWQDVDFENIAKLGLNCVRLPFYYRTVMEGDNYHLTMKDDAFKWLDWFIEGCKDNGLYVILDCHGVVGSQNKYEHSGDNTQNSFWDNQTYIDQTIAMWKAIADHYINIETELGKSIVAYDIMNEPTGSGANGTFTGKKQWEVFDQIIKGIREVDEYHCISVEGCWGYSNLPNPSQYGWTNVLYQYHWYNWIHDTVPYSLFYYYQDYLLPFNNHDTAKLLGEFNFFDSKEDWNTGLSLLEKRNHSWTTWTYKAVVVGYWNTSWSLYTFKLNSDEQTDCKVNVATATAEQLITTWGGLSTQTPGYNAEWFTAKGIEKLPYTVETSNVYGFIKDFLAGK
ncbi:MAG: cellulase family glycosylhydrolase [Clostridia bacterium]